MPTRSLLGAAASTRGILFIVAASALALGTLIVAQVRTRELRSGLMREDPDLLPDNAQLVGYAESIARPVYANHCAGCHGGNLQGDHERGAPALNDEIWLYNSGRVIEMEQVIRYGIRSGEPRSPNVTDMPAFGRTAKLTPEEIHQVVAYVLSLSGQKSDPALAAEGKKVFNNQGSCWDCHQGDGKGNSAYGAPDLTGSAWLHGADEASIHTSVYDGRHGVCPAWIKKLDPVQIRAMAVYLYAASHARNLKGE